jgi:hypothetical protein
MVLTIISLTGIVILVAWLVILGIKKIASEYPPAAPEQSPVSGVGGWLLLLICILLLDPLRAFNGLSGFDVIEFQNPNILLLAGYSTYKTVTRITFLLAAGLSFYAGASLTGGRNISVVNRAKIILWISGPLSYLIVDVFLPYIVFQHYKFSPESMSKVLISCIVAAVWTVYLYKSKRVKGTYGNRTENA